jgi:RimJ/RimL family protein N-acetyltransferase
MDLPTLETQRLVLRPFDVASDAEWVQKYAGDYAVASTTLLIPHPYEDGMAETWIKSLDPTKEVTLAVVSREAGHLIGSISLILDFTHRLAEIGYWVGKPFWGKGYCAEAGASILEYGFEALGLNCIVGIHFSENIASGKVLKKINFKHEASLRQRRFRFGEYKNLEVYSILKSEYLSYKEGLQASVRTLPDSK